MMAVALLGGACGGPPAAGTGQVRPVYDDKTGRLSELQYDSNADGTRDVRVFMDGKRPVRAEIDANQDGATERWEYFDAAGRIERVGTASANDGREDTWTYVDAKEQIVKIERKRAGATAVTRREFFRDGALHRVEEDSDADGRLDKWETYVNGVVAELALDTTHTRGRPDRRLVYGAAGALQRIEADPDGDGRFAFVASAASEEPEGQVEPR
jgi:hypothetical protein